MPYDVIPISFSKFLNEPEEQLVLISHCLRTEIKEIYGHNCKRELERSSLWSWCSSVSDGGGVYMNQHRIKLHRTTHICHEYRYKLVNTE